MSGQANPFYLIERPDGTFDVAHSTMSHPQLGFQVLKGGLPRHQALALAHMLGAKEGEPVTSWTDQGVDPWIRSRSRRPMYTPGLGSKVRSRMIHNPRRSRVMVQAERPGVTGLPQGAWKSWPVSKLVAHFARLAKRAGAGTAMRAVLNIERWNKHQDPKLSRKAGQVVEGLKRSRTYQGALAANPCRGNPCRTNPQLMVVGNPRRRNAEGQPVAAPADPAALPAPAAAPTAAPAGKKNPQLQVIGNPSAIPGIGSQTVKKAERAYKRFHMTAPAQTLEGWVPDGWPKAYITIGECLRFDVVGKNGKKFHRSFKKGSRPALCTTAECKEVFLFGDLRGFPSGQALRVDYRVPAHSGRAKWARDWTHDHDSRPNVVAHPSGRAIRISGKKLKVTPRGIEH